MNESVSVFWLLPAVLLPITGGALYLAGFWMGAKSSKPVNIVMEPLEFQQQPVPPRRPESGL